MKLMKLPITPKQIEEFTDMFAIGIIGLVAVYGDPQIEILSAITGIALGKHVVKFRRN